MNHTSLFSELLSPDELSSVDLYSYFPVKVSGEGDELICKLLPSDHAIAYPLEFNPKTGDVLKGELNFYNQPLFDNFTTANQLESKNVQFDVSPSKSKALIVNLLDNCFGHSFLKLLNILSIHKEYGGEYDIVAIVPSCLKYLLPEDKVKSCAVQIGFHDLEDVYNLDLILNKIKSKYAEFDFPVLNTYQLHSSRTELIDFFNFLNHRDKTKPKQYITFFYRKDPERKWGGNRQHINVTQLFNKLRRYFTEDAKFCVVGEEDETTFPNWIEDYRISVFNTEADLRDNLIYDQSIIVIGLHGSNLLIPSLLSELVIHLCPNFKRHNALEDAVNYQSGLLDTYYENHNVLIGSPLHEMRSAELCSYLVTHYLSALEKRFKVGSADDVGALKDHPSQNQYIRARHPYFRLDEARRFKHNREKRELRILRILNTLRKINPFS